MPNLTMVATEPKGRRYRKAAEAVEEGMRDGLDEVGRFAVAEVKNVGRRSFRNPTGYYLGHVTYDVSTKDLFVHDSGVVYGAWLEGTSSRNARSRFKGYRLWQQALTRVRAMARETIDSAIERRMGRA